MLTLCRGWSLRFILIALPSRFFYTLPYKFLPVKNLTKLNLYL